MGVFVNWGGIFCGIMSSKLESDLRFYMLLLWHTWGLFNANPKVLSAHTASVIPNI